MEGLKALEEKSVKLFYTVAAGFVASGAVIILATSQPRAVGISLIASGLVIAIGVRWSPTE